MLTRKIQNVIEKHLTSDSDTALLIDGARQVGKTYIINHVGNKLFKNFIDIDMLQDSLGNREYADITTIDDFYFQISTRFGKKLGNYEDTLIFIDEIQAYPHLLTMLKFLVDDKRYKFIASGSMLGVALNKTLSIPMGRIKKIRMYPLDFEEFLLANGFSDDAIYHLREAFSKQESLSESIHNKLMDLFRKFLIVGGLPKCVKEYVNSKNLYNIRQYQSEIYEYYQIDSAQYSKENKLNIRALYDAVVSFMENKKKRVVINKIGKRDNARFENYNDEFQYLLSSGICLGVSAISNPVFPLVQSTKKNLIKLYYNDPGILSNLLYRFNTDPILKDDNNINLGALYETAVASELAAHDHNLYYYDNRNKGEVDFLVDNYNKLSVVPIEIKSGRDYSIHSALNNLTSNKDYNVALAYVFSNKREIHTKGKIIYSPIYNIMFV